MGNWHVWIYFTGQNWIQVKIFKPRFDSQFPLSLSPNSWILIGLENKENSESM